MGVGPQEVVQGCSPGRRRAGRETHAAGRGLEAEQCSEYVGASTARLAPAVGVTNYQRRGSKERTVLLLAGDAAEPLAEPHAQQGAPGSSLGLLWPRHQIPLNNLLNDLQRVQQMQARPAFTKAALLQSSVAVGLGTPQREALATQPGRQAAQAASVARRAWQPARAGCPNPMLPALPSTRGRPPLPQALSRRLACAGSSPSVRSAGFDASMPTKIKVGSPWICSQQRTRGAAEWFKSGSALANCQPRRLRQPNSWAGQQGRRIHAARLRAGADLQQQRRQTPARPSPAAGC